MSINSSSKRDLRLNDISVDRISYRYRVEVRCLNCGAIYVTRLIDSVKPRKCKHCGSTKLYYNDKWEYR